MPGREGLISWVRVTQCRHSHNVSHLRGFVGFALTYISSFLWNYYDKTNAICRCSDSTEFGSHFSSTLCPSCESPCTPVDKGAGWEWVCESCGKKVSQKLVDNMVDKLEKEVEELDMGNSVQDTEDILERLVVNIFIVLVRIF